MTRSFFDLDPSRFAFSGHETFVLRSNWLKKAYDLLLDDPALFYCDDAFVRLGVGKNMAQSIRYWGRVCAVFDRGSEPRTHTPTWLGHALFNDRDGWDPFLVAPASHWLLHYRIASRSDAAFSWYYTFNLLRRGEFTLEQLVQQIHDLVRELGGKVPAATTLARDVECMLRCHQRPSASQLASAAEDALHCPIYTLGLVQQIPGQPIYRLVSGMQPDLPDALVVYAALKQAQLLDRPTVAFNELAYGECSPGRIFRLDEDALLARLMRFEALTDGRGYYNDTGGIRQIIWGDLGDDEDATIHGLLARAFETEDAYV